MFLANITQLNVEPNSNDDLWFSQTGRWDLACSWDIASECNPRLRDVIDECKNDNHNFIVVDYPNYPVGPDTVADIAKEVNMARL